MEHECRNSLQKLFVYRNGTLFLYCIKFLDKSKLGKKIEQISNKILVCF